MLVGIQSDPNVNPKGYLKVTIPDSDQTEL